jgi:hypothetical protein
MPGEPSALPYRPHALDAVRLLLLLLVARATCVTAAVIMDVQDSERPGRGRCAAEAAGRASSRGAPVQRCSEVRLRQGAHQAAAERQAG